MSFDNTALPERLAIVQNTGLRFTLFATSGQNENNLVTISLCKCHQPTSGDRLIVRVSVETHKRCH
jgi:hypothetical protein